VKPFSKTFGELKLVEVVLDDDDDDDDNANGSSIPYLLLLDTPFFLLVLLSSINTSFRTASIVEVTTRELLLSLVVLLSVTEFDGIGASGLAPSYIIIIIIITNYYYYYYIYIYNV